MVIIRKWKIYYYSTMATHHYWLIFGTKVTHVSNLTKTHAKLVLGTMT
jgi:hypothetical protein